MKKFTVKDFIAYNNPCFNCGRPINFKVSFVDLDDTKEISSLRPIVTSYYTEIDLLITYSDALKLYIFHKTNKFSTNNHVALTNYLSRHKLFLTSSCDRCYTMIESQYLDFNMEKNQVDAVGLAFERLMVNDGYSIYQINSFFSANKSSLVVDKIDRVKPLSPLTLELPLLPKFRFRDKEHFIEKMKTYITFS